MNNLNQFDENLRGAWDIMLGRKDGLARIDLSGGGLWWSFSGLLLTGLVDATALSLRYGGAVALQEDPPSRVGYIVLTLLINLMGYAVAMGLLYLVCRDPDEKKRFPYAIIVNNWAAPIISVAMLPLMVLSLVSPADANGGQGGTIWIFITMGLLIALVIIGSRILQTALDTDRPRAFWLFAITTVVSIITVEGLERLAGLSSAA